ncbi:MAG: cell division protein ZapA, partial [Sarcina sp.]
MNTVIIKINGVEYNLKGEEDEEYLKHVANYVEGKIQDILEKNPRLPGPAASALTAVNVANELFKGNKEFNELLDSFKQIE